ncbi:selenocysteine-specific translation elongation factor [Dermacoccus sp. PAMC28757]|uniref:selenocysteine-specific translation elongation factor n=1 Tax=Dermacoccus sp. PAMC28757 TaxID=2762331 RepID=UPI00164D0598|nr:selenocysteine-specific translation elongation factor [Dermacoccus sp. PAMC28757]QNK52933.1 selenocysteine-specific translation elongation factor [Dermacoccus sp. PAMC28757]
MRVIATAGHVDHGKSTLVQALTGTDPDRWAEEKRRGLTIDLGFAGLELPSGEHVAFVDVPGHRRFIGNMLAGLGPAPAVMLVVAADQGWQAQSSEHLDAIDALGLETGLLVLTRCGLADADRVAEVRRSALEHIAQTSLGAVRVVETDAVQGDGIGELRSALDDLVAGMPPLDGEGSVRMWLDRSFSVKGAGTVVTGTLAHGTLRVGDEVSVAGERATIRSIQVLGESRDEVGPVSRCAVGLRGITRDAAPRGSALLRPAGGLESTTIDVRRETGCAWSESSREVSVHVGTADVPARVRPFDDETARLRLESPLPLRLGDRVIVRDDSAARIHAGATVLDLDPPPLERRGAGAARAATLAGWESGRASDLVVDRGHVSVAWLEGAGATGWGDWPLALPNGDGFGIVDRVAVSAAQVTAWSQQLDEHVGNDARDPLSPGVAVAALARELDTSPAVVHLLAAASGLDVDAGRVRGAEHRRDLGGADTALAQLRERLQASPFDAPEADDLTAWKLGSREIAAAAERGLVLRLRAQPADIVLLPDAPARAMRELAALPQPFTTSDARQALGTTRRVVIPLLEHLDARGWTRRDGNTRTVVR